MKVPLSIKDVYDSNISRYITLKKYVDEWIVSIKKRNWHYESRVKELESFALKYETGRFTPASIFDDAFAGMIVVPSYKDIPEVERLLIEKYSFQSKKPNSSSFATYSPSSFVFDDLRLYLQFNNETHLSPNTSELNGIIFEIQVKTFLQHAWSLSTHDLIYKSENISWSKHRVAYQVKAMLENIELSISSVEQLAGNGLISKEDKRFKLLGKLVNLFDEKWDRDLLPADKKRLAENISECMLKLDVKFGELRDVINDSGCNKLKSISPYQSIIMALINHRFECFQSGNPNGVKLLMSSEVMEMIDEDSLNFLSENDYLIGC